MKSRAEHSLAWSHTWAAFHFANFKPKNMILNTYFTDFIYPPLRQICKWFLSNNTGCVYWSEIQWHQWPEIGHWRLPGYKVSEIRLTNTLSFWSIREVLRYVLRNDLIRLFHFTLLFSSRVANFINDQHILLYSSQLNNTWLKFNRVIINKIKIPKQ